MKDSENQIRQKEAYDMLSMISYAEENGIKKGENILLPGCLGHDFLPTTF
ncbi:hypothetical protein ACTQWG_05910 [Blautia sp. HCP3S3_H10_1]|nr:hypothetical protein [Clostridia bacterium]